MQNVQTAALRPLPVVKVRDHYSWIRSLLLSRECAMYDFVHAAERGDAGGAADAVVRVNECTDLLELIGVPA